jgi:hypothetical protein
MPAKSETPAGYSGTPLWKKLGYKTGQSAFVHQAPRNYSSLLQLPADVAVTWAKQFKPGLSFVHLFVTDLADLRTRLAKYRNAIAPDGAVWVSWPKKSSGVPTDITEDRIRDAALPLGFVDIKVCAVDDTWSGLKLVIRKELR